MSVSPALIDFLDSTVLALDPVERFRRAIAEPDQWQVEFLEARDQFVCCLVSRQCGKSSATSILAYDAITRGEFVLVLAPSERQSRELARKVLFARSQDRHSPALIRSTLTEIELANSGRFVVIPASSDTIRGYSAADLIILEEAAFIDDDVINAVLPSRAESGRVIAITTPGGSKDCFFFHAWQGNVRRIIARSTEIPRMAKKVAFDRQHMPAIRFRVEHELEWLGSGEQFISHEVIAGAVTMEVGAMRL